jgi:hypothetical protein
VWKNLECEVCKGGSDRKRLPAMLLGAAGGADGVKADIWASHAPSSDGAKDTVRCRLPMHRAYE